MTRTVVFACARSNLGGALPAGVELIEVPCTGRVSLPLLLGAFVGGAEGVLVLGRHESTCRLRGAEESARDRVARASLLLGLVGIAPGRLRFAEPEPGPAGPRAALRAFLDDLAPLGPAHEVAPAPAPELLAHESLDATLALLDALSARHQEPPPIVETALASWLAAEGLPVATPATAVLLPGRLAELALAAGELLRPMRPAALLGAALTSLARLGRPAGIARTLGQAARGDRFTAFTVRAGTEDAASEDAAPVEAWLAARAARLPRPVAAARVACNDEAAAALLEALGHRPLLVATHALPERFTVTPDERRDASRYLADLEARGAAAVYVGDALTHCRWAAMTRHGAWQASFLLPVTGAQLAQLSWARLPLTPSLLASPLSARERALCAAELRA